MTFLAAIALSHAGVSITPGPVFEGLHPVAFAAAPTGSRVLVNMEDGTDRIFDAQTRCTVRALAKHPQAAYAACWCSCRPYVATGDETARIWIENALTGQKVREYRTHTKGIEKLSFNRAGNLLISTGKDDEIKVYDLDKPGPKEVQHILGKGANFYGAQFNPQLPYTFATAILQEGGGRTYDANSGGVKNFLGGHDSQGAMDVAFNAQGSLVASAGKDGTTVILDAKTFKKIGTLKGHSDWVMAVTFSPNGKLVATSSTDRTVKIWNATSLQCLSTLQNQSPVGSPLAFTGDGKALMTVSDQGFLQVNTVSPPQAAEPLPVLTPAAAAKTRHHHSHD
jgi:WD40 repeat protein